MRIKYLVLILPFVLGTFYLSLTNSGDDFNTLSSAKAEDSINIKKNTSSETLEISLRAVAMSVAEVIISKDIPGLLKHIASNVHYGGDLYKSFDEVKGDLHDSTSAMYCFLFNIECYPDKDLQKGIRDYLLEAKSRNLKVNVEIEGKDHIVGTVIYEWDGKPDDLWVYKFPNPQFIHTESCWKLSSLFAE